MPAPSYRPSLAFSLPTYPCGLNVRDAIEARTAMMHRMVQQTGINEMTRYNPDEASAMGLAILPTQAGGMARTQDRRAPHRYLHRDYDPQTEADPLVRRHVVLRSASSQKSDPVIVGTSGHPYPAWSVYLIYRIVNGDVGRAVENYGGDLSADQIKAAARYAELYPDEVLPWVDAALDESYGRRPVRL
jgi:hypothetical protein